MNTMNLVARIALGGMLAVVIAFAPAGARAADSQPVKATSEPYVPFVTDFPKPTSNPVPVAEAPVAPGMAPAAPEAGTSGIDWRDVGLGSGIGAAFVALLAGSALVYGRRARPVLTRHERSA